MMATMNRTRWPVAAVVVALAAGGCGGQGPSAKVTSEQLQQSFEKAELSIQQEVAQAGAALEAGRYTEAIVTMERVAQTQPVDEAQKKAVGQLIQQTQQAVRRDPKLNSPELYRAVSDLILRVHGEN